MKNWFFWGTLLWCSLKNNKVIGGLIWQFCYISPPTTLSFFEQFQHTVPQKNQFLIYNQYLVHKRISFSKKLRKVKITFLPYVTLVRYVLKLWLVRTRPKHGPILKIFWSMEYFWPKEQKNFVADVNFSFLKFP